MEAVKALFERLDKVPEEVNVNAVFGTPQTIGGLTLIPVAEIMYGFGAGVGSGPSNECDEASADADAVEGKTATGVGGGAGAKARPIAYIAVGPEGARVQPIMDEQKVALAGLLLGFWAIGWVGLVLKTLFTRPS
ncbi:MAG: hypothetical protein J7M39_10290 [Anaerolineae bacterium]|nr:hypothetical protein [Anaerolineae bacterium]